MKFVRVLLRSAFLSLAAAACAGLTAIYGGSVRRPLPNPGWQAARQHRPSAPEVGKFPEFVGEAVTVAIYAVAGRIVFRLRLSPASRSEGQPILLGLHQEAKTAKS
ncbi:MAG: hypothetical protein WB676_01660 [Bryobacteraceae bacterium]